MHRMRGMRVAVCAKNLAPCIWENTRTCDVGREMFVHMVLVGRYSYSSINDEQLRAWVPRREKSRKTRRGREGK
jgi:hypothetical protein